TTLLVGLIFGLSSATNAAQHPCSSDAVMHAESLLLLHTENDDRAKVDSKITALPSFKNPANTNQRFDVLEVMGYVYKGEYRMRMIYAQMPGSCVLMGQEILE